MKHIIFSSIVFQLCCICLIGQSNQSGIDLPKIAKTIPAFGQLDVDPNLSEIQVIFNQRMSGTYSVINTQHMPKNAGDAKWVNDSTFVIPVSLQPNRLYSLAFNNQKYSGFRNKQGMPMNPDELLFITESVNTNDLNKEAYQELFKVFPEHYSYNSLKGIDWHSEFKEKEKAFVESTTPLEFAISLISILKRAEDPHMWIEVSGDRFGSWGGRITQRNYGSAQIFGTLKEKKVADKFMSVAGSFDSIGYISFNNWTVEPDKLAFRSWGNSKNPIVPTSQVLEDLMRYPNLIIDVRENGGGNEGNAREIASYFVHDSVPFEIVKYHNPETGKFDMERTKWLHSYKEETAYDGNIYVLTGPSAMSSNESFLLMMKQLPNCQLVGMRSFGSTGNPKPVELPNGIQIFIPSWQAFTMTGDIIEGNGIEPDIEIITKEQDFTRESDPLFQQVVSIINEDNN